LAPPEIAPDDTRISEPFGIHVALSGFSPGVASGRASPAAVMSPFSGCKKTSPIAHVVRRRNSSVRPSSEIAGLVSAIAGAAGVVN
jgi:hypothetical protein